MATQSFVAHGSSNIGSVHHHDDGTLQVAFTNGSVYEFDGVDADTFKALKEATSVGEAFHRHVKGRFKYRKVS